MVDDLDERSQFYIALGRALNAWQALEFQAYLIFEVMMKRTPKQLRSVVFHHNQSFRSQILLLDRCAFFAMPDTMKADWAKLKKRLNTQRDIRNRMVHFKLSRTAIDGRQQFYLGPSSANEINVIKDRASDPEFKMTRSRLRRAENDFQRLRVDLAHFEQALRAIAR